MSKVAILAGEGFLPLEAVKSLQQRGHEIIVVSFLHPAPVDLTEVAGEVVTFSLTQVGKVLNYLKNCGATEMVFAGKFSRRLLEENLKFDLKALWMLARLKDRQEDTIMNAITLEIEKLGLTVLSQADVLSHLLVQKGVYSKKKPSKAQLDDVEFGFEKGKGIAGLDIGQSIIVKKKSVIAVEAIEGTDLAILRSGELAKDFTLVKVAKPMQDYRFDMPVIGMTTMNNFKKAGGKVFALEAGSTLIVNLQECIDFADENGIIFMAV